MHLLYKTNLQLINIRVIYAAKLISAHYKLCRSPVRRLFPPSYLSGTIGGLTRGRSVLDGAFLHSARDTGMQERKEGLSTRLCRPALYAALTGAINHMNPLQILKYSFADINTLTQTYRCRNSVSPFTCCAIYPSI